MKSTTSEPSRPRTTLLRKLMLLAASALVALVAAEVAVRVVGLGPVRCKPRLFFPEAPTLVTLPTGPVVYQANTVFGNLYDTACDTRGYFGDSGRVTYRINNHGLRGPDFAMQKVAGVRRIICLGDSITFGEGVHEEDTYPVVLATLVPQPVEVINAGVQAYDTVREVGMYQGYLSAAEPDVIIVGLFLNDAMDVLETVRQFEVRADDQPSWLAARSRLIDWIEHRQRKQRVQAAYFQHIRDSFASERWTRGQRALRWLRQQADADGFEMVVVVFPILWGLDTAYPFEDVHAKIRAACGEMDVACIDLLDVYRGHAAQNLWAHPTDHHPNEVAHRLAAEAVAEHLHR